MSTTSFLIVDDHPLFRAAIRDLLAGEFTDTLIDEAADGVACLEKLSKTSYDLVLLDINMAGMNGIDCLKRIKETTPSQKVAVLTQHENLSFYKRLKEMKADAYLLKSAASDTLVQAIGCLIKDNQRCFPDELVPLDKSSAKYLTVRETEIIQLLMDDYSSTEIASSLAISESTVYNHRAAITRKLNVRNMEGAIKLAIEMGLVTVP